MKKIAVFTGNRAEYGLMVPVLRAIEAHPDLDYVLFVSGAHLDENFGSTLEEIKNDGFIIHEEIKINFRPDTLTSTSLAISSTIEQISHALKKYNPDIHVVYADRFEGFGAIIASTQMNIPTAHIEGGDITEGGALDDSVRHAMTKLSHIHFTTNQQASNRVLAMGEEAWRVHTVGFPAIDLIDKSNFATSADIEKNLGIDTNMPVILFTQHSVTTEFTKSVDQLEPSLEAMLELAKLDIQVLLTYPNNDAGGLSIIKRLSELSLPKNVYLHKSLGRFYYHGVLALAKSAAKKVVCVGNSSSGLKETPAFGCPTVNIGTRQQGRLRGENVIDVGYETEEIVNAVKKCLFDPSFRELCRVAKNPYSLGDAGKKIANVLAEIDLNTNLIRKKMTLNGEVRDGWFR